MTPWLERQRNFLDFTLSSLLRRKWKNAALLVVYVLVVFLVASVMMFADAIRKEARKLLQDAPEIVVQRIMAGRQDLVPLSYADKVREIRGVGSVTGRLWGYYYHLASRANYTVMAADPFALGEDQIQVGTGVVQSWQGAQGNQLYFKAYDGETLVLTAAGFLSSASDLVAADLIVTSHATFRRLFGVPEAFATDLAVSVRNHKEAATIAEKIVKLFPDTRPILREQILRTYDSVLDWRSGYVIVLLSGAVLAFFIFAWDKATGLSAEERTEIGTLKALGWDTSDILVMKSWEGTVISFSAFLVGVILAYVHVFFAAAPLFQHALKGWSVIFPTFRLTPAVDPYQIAILFFLTVLPYTLITIVPAWRVSVTDPDTVMRNG
jgi:ABC-type lipoprotein release transport system permease subunit